MSRQAIVKQWSEILGKWPVDRLRPEQQQFASLLKKRVEEAPKDARDEMREVNAARNMLDNAFKTRFTLSSTIMEPASKPTYYKDLAKELDEIPDRSWVSSQLKRWSNILRWK